MANDTAQPNKPTVIYSPLRLNWKNVAAGTVIGLLMVAIGVFSFTYYNPNATPIPPVVIKSGTKSAEISKATPSAETADWKTLTNKLLGYAIKHPENWLTNDPNDTLCLGSGFFAPNKELLGLCASGFSGLVSIGQTDPPFDIEQQLSSYKKTHNFKNYKETETTVDGKKTTKISGISQSEPEGTDGGVSFKDYRYIIYLIDLEDRVLNLTYSQAPSWEDYSETFENMVKSFKFLD